MITYNGGNIIVHPKIQAIYLGSQWETNPAYSQLRAKLEVFLPLLVNGPWMDILTGAGYGCGRGGVIPGMTAVVVFDPKVGISEKMDVRGNIQGLITAGQVQQPDDSTIYVVFTSPGFKVIPVGSQGSSGCHWTFAGTNREGAAKPIRYVLVRGGDLGFTTLLQTKVDAMTWVASMEIAESCTDPDIGYAKNGWYNNEAAPGPIGGGEICDNNGWSTWNGYKVGKPMNQKGIACAVNTIFPPLEQPTVRLKPLSPSLLRVEWSTVQNCLGYRLWRIDGPLLHFITEVNAMVHSCDVAVEGFAGQPVVIAVDAFNRLTDSIPVMTVMPKTMAELQTVVLAGVAESATKIKLNWSAGWSVTKFTLYQWFGDDRILLDDGDKSFTSMGSNVAAGSTTRFQVEATDGTTTVKSNILMIITPEL